MCEHIQYSDSSEIFSRARSSLQGSRDLWLTVPHTSFMFAQRRGADDAVACQTAESVWRKERSTERHGRAALGLKKKAAAWPH